MTFDPSKLNNNPFSEFGVEYVWQPYWTFVNPQNGAVDVDYFEQFQNKLVVINFASENWGENFDSQVCEQLSDANVNFLLLTYNHKKHQLHPRMFYYPHWYHTSMWFWQKHYPDDIPTPTTRNYFIGCLNGKSRPHRIANFLKLKKAPYWNKVCISFSNESDPRHDDFELEGNEKIEWEKSKLELSRKPFYKSSSKDDVTHPQLLDSYLHLVAEVTALPTIFTSEKTWKPIAAAVPFVIWGDVGSMSFLKSQGIDIYDDVIDHKYYDTEQDARQRLNKLHSIIDDLIKQGVEKIYNQLASRAKINQTKFFQGNFDLNYRNTIIDAINKYK